MFHFHLLHIFTIVGSDKTAMRERSRGEEEIGEEIELEKRRERKEAEKEKERRTERA